MLLKLITAKYEIVVTWVLAHIGIRGMSGQISCAK